MKNQETLLPKCATTPFLISQAQRQRYSPELFKRLEKLEERKMRMLGRLRTSNNGSFFLDRLALICEELTYYTQVILGRGGDYFEA